MQEEARTSNSSSTFWIFLAGAATGAVVVALTTPKRGAELRGDLRELGRKAKDKAQHWTGEMVEAWSETKGRTSKAGHDIMRGFRDAAADLRG